MTPGIQRDERVSSANAEIQKYNASIEAYLLDPEAYLLDRYLESFQQALAQQRKYIVGPGVDAGALYANFGLGGSGSRWFSGLDGGGARRGAGGGDTDSGDAGGDRRSAG